MDGLSKTLAVVSAVVAGPLLASAAISVRHHLDTPPAAEDDFDLGGVFISPDGYGEKAQSIYTGSNFNTNSDNHI